MNNPLRICFFGDSFANGTGDDDCLGWVGRLCAAARRSGCDVTAYNLGIRRDTSGDIANRWQSEGAARLPDQYDGRLVFAFGTNDCVTHEDGDGPRVPMDRAIANAHEILSAARAWKTYWAAPGRRTSRVSNNRNSTSSRTAC